MLHSGLRLLRQLLIRCLGRADGVIVGSCARLVTLTLLTLAHDLELIGMVLALTCAILLFNYLVWPSAALRLRILFVNLLVRQVDNLSALA